MLSAGSKGRTVENDRSRAPARKLVSYYDVCLLEEDVIFLPNTHDNRDTQKRLGAGGRSSWRYSFRLVPAARRTGLGECDGNPRSIYITLLLYIVAYNANNARSSLATRLSFRSRAKETR